MESAGYDFQNPTILENVVEVKPHGLNETQKRSKDKEGR